MVREEEGCLACRVCCRRRRTRLLCQLREEKSVSLVQRSKCTLSLAGMARESTLR